MTTYPYPYSGPHYHAERARLLQLLTDRGWQSFYGHQGWRHFPPGQRSGIGFSEGEALKWARLMVKEENDG